jgi:hypothetical protein
MMSLTSVETFGLHSFHGKKCSKVILEKLTMWSALCVRLWTGKEVNLELELDTLEKHGEKTKSSSRYATFG